MKNLLSKLTLVIPTYNRQSYALRNARYWSGQGATVLIMDGSDTPILTDDLAGIECNVQYHYNNVNFEDRLNMASSYINTEYAMLCGDDEFQVYSGLIACIEFLEANEDYTSCCGRCVGFSVKKDKVELFPEKAYHSTHLVNQSLISERIKYHIGNYMVTTIYGVHRLNSFKFCVSGISKLCSCVYVSETVFELLSAAYGKSIVLPNLTWLRSSENNPVQTDTNDRKYYISQWYDDPSKVKEIDGVYGGLKKLLNTICGISERKVVWDATCFALKLRFKSDRASIVRLTSKQSLTELLKLILLRKTIALSKQLVKLILQKMNLRFSFSFYVSPKKYSYKSLQDSADISIGNDEEINSIMQNILDFHRKFGSNSRSGRL
jgi:glycosyltransferase domain-containing protein